MFAVKEEEEKKVKHAAVNGCNYDVCSQEKYTVKFHERKVNAMTMLGDRSNSARKERKGLKET